jgi:hypothetical protein
MDPSISPPRDGCNAPDPHGIAFTVRRSPFTGRCSKFGVRSSGFGVRTVRRCGWPHTALTITLTPNLNPFRPSCPLHLCGESPSPFTVHRSPGVVRSSGFGVWRWRLVPDPLERSSVICETSSIAAPGWGAASRIVYDFNYRSRF